MELQCDLCKFEPAVEVQGMSGKLLLPNVIRLQLLESHRQGHIAEMRATVSYVRQFSKFVRTDNRMPKESVDAIQLAGEVFARHMEERQQLVVQDEEASD